MTDRISRLFEAAVERAGAMRQTPGATYRVQLHRGFTFRDAAGIVPYLADLGITHLYCSPYLAAVAGSTHGYDVIDPTKLNPELGTVEDYTHLLSTLADHGMSHILDTVPNHAGVATNDNPWWNDVLKHGRNSPFGAFFDIAWTASPRPQLHEKVLLPLLGGPYGEVLEKGELGLVRDGGDVFVTYYQRRFPIDPETLEHDLVAYHGTPGDVASWDDLDALLERQHYRLAYLRTAPDEINYRRFFDINDLAALAMERTEVFEAAHAFVLPRLARGEIAGLRIDHPDGLFDPARYFLRLQHHFILAVAERVVAEDDRFTDFDFPSIRPRLLEHVERVFSTSSDSADPSRPLYVAVEKILAPHEPLPTSWAVDGTSGYDFLIKVNGLFVDPAGEASLTACYTGFTGLAEPFHDLAYRLKKHILETALTGELHMLAHELDRLARRDRHSRDFTLGGLTAALCETIAAFPVYRSYVDACGPTSGDHAFIKSAVEEAIARNPRVEARVFHFIRDTLLGTFGDRFTQQDRADQRHFAGKFQQLTAPVTAKGVEDTAFYRYNRLLSLNEVGGEPAQFGVTTDALHAYFATRQRDWPDSLSVLTTHDTKRGEDVRARLNVLSEIPDEWQTRINRWASLNAPYRTESDGKINPDRNDEYAIYQTILGVWPVDSGEEQDPAVFTKRIVDWARKAIREAKLHSSWTDPDKAYENAVERFIRALLDPATGHEFRKDLIPFAEKVAAVGRVYSLSQTLLRLTAPGVPDTYQGTERTAYSLVDPDNRRTVNYDEAARLLASLGEPSSNDIACSFEHKKLVLHWHALALRKSYTSLFARGDYMPLTVKGSDADRIFAFARVHGMEAVIVAVPRNIVSACNADTLDPAAVPASLDARVILPPPIAAQTFCSVLGHAPTTAIQQDGDFGISASGLFRESPIALFINAACPWIRSRKEISDQRNPARSVRDIDGAMS